MFGLFDFVDVEFGFDWLFSCCVVVLWFIVVFGYGWYSCVLDVSLIFCYFAYFGFCVSCYLVCLCCSCFWCSWFCCILINYCCLLSFVLFGVVCLWLEFPVVGWDYILWVCDSLCIYVLVFVWFVLWVLVCGDILGEFVCLTLT